MFKLFKGIKKFFHIIDIILKVIFWMVVAYLVYLVAKPIYRSVRYSMLSSCIQSTSAQIAAIEASGPSGPSGPPGDASPSA